MMFIVWHSTCVVIWILANNGLLLALGCVCVCVRYCYEMQCCQWAVGLVGAALVLLRIQWIFLLKWNWIFGPHTNISLFNELNKQQIHFVHFEIESWRLIMMRLKQNKIKQNRSDPKTDCKLNISLIISFNLCNKSKIYQSDKGITADRTTDDLC